MAEQGFTLTSPDFTHDGDIPSPLTCDGTNRPPELRWIHPPDRTRSFALIVEDPDAPNGTFTHWVTYDIPATVDRLTADGKTSATQGRNDFQQTGYGGPCPPPNHGKHRYHFRLFATDLDSLGLASGATKNEVARAMQSHILGETVLSGLYQRSTG